ncbi:MAG: hypothetical protein V4596_12125 [Bdellovibrionota bacterium]
MNYMKDKGKDFHLQKLSLSIGDFIRYWGFRRIHGAIWTQIYVSKAPLSCKDLTVSLGLSKALVSPALEELCQYRLIHEAPSPNKKTKLYVATENISEVIKHVLKNREAKILQKITKNFSTLKSAQSKKTDVNLERLKSLEEMISAANLMLGLFVTQKDVFKLSME